MKTPELKPTRNGRVRSSELVVPLVELQKRVKGREIELHFQPLAGPVWARNSVYVRGDERDEYSTCVASGHGGTMAVALRRALTHWAKRHNDKLSHAAEQPKTL
jgi:hypothetical protein